MYEISREIFPFEKALRLKVLIIDCSLQQKITISQIEDDGFCSPKVS